MNDASRPPLDLSRLGITEADAPHLFADYSTEQWAHVPDYQGYYSVSTWGSPRSETRTITRRDERKVLIRGHALSTRSHATNGFYPMLTLSIDGVARHHYLHRLVLETFIGPCPPGLVTRHLDGNPANARLDNLVYGTPSDNMYDKEVHGTNDRINQTHCRYNHVLAPPNLVESTLPFRHCLACNRARPAIATLRRQGDRSTTHQELSDRKYATIMAGIKVRRPRGSANCLYGHPLVPINLVRSGKGVCCLACSRAYGVAARIRVRGDVPDFQAISDAKFAKIAGLLSPPLDSLLGAR